MDYLRSGYTTSIHCFNPLTGLDHPAVIVWSKAPPLAYPLNRRHQYASSNYGNRIPYTEQVGELVPFIRSWNNGRTPLGLGGIYACPGQWTGILHQASTPIVRDGNGQPVCCSARPLVGCDRCSRGTGFATYYLRASGGTGDFAQLNGDYPLFFDGPGTCQWRNVFGGPGSPAWSVGWGGAWRVTGHPAGSGFPSVLYSITTPYDCFIDHLTWPLTSSSGGGIRPTIQVLTDPP